MLSVLEEKRAGFRFYYTLSDGENSYGGGLTDGGFLFADAACPYKELMLRTLINKCINEFVPAVKAEDEWGADLARFGFKKNSNGIFTASFETLALPHGCGN